MAFAALTDRAAAFTPVRVHATSAGCPGPTAAAVAALVLAERHGMCLAGDAFGESNDSAYQGDLSETIIGSLHWLAERQNADGGWGEPGKGSTVEATLFTRVAIQLTGVPACYADLESRADAYLRGLTQGPNLLKRMGRSEHRTYPLVGACAAAGLTPWTHVPRGWLWRTIHGASSTRIAHRPAVIATALARWRMSKRLVSIRKTIGRSVEPRLLTRLEGLQTPAGVFADSLSETALVVLLLTSAGLRRTQAVQRGVDALLTAIQPDGSWPEAAGAVWPAAASTV